MDQYRVFRLPGSTAAQLFIPYKNPGRYIRLAKEGLLPSDDNFWYGSSVTGPHDMYSWFSKDYHWFLSVEPILDDLGKMDPDAQKPEWIIVGAETGRRAGKWFRRRNGLKKFVSSARIMIYRYS